MTIGLGGSSASLVLSDAGPTGDTAPSLLWHSLSTLDSLANQISV